MIKINLSINNQKIIHKTNLNMVELFQSNIISSYGTAS